MSSKYYYQNCIENYEEQIAENERKIQILEEAKSFVDSEKSNEEQYLSDRSFSISMLQYANSVGVIEYGEELSHFISYYEQTTVLSYYDSINTKIDYKIEQLREDISHLESEIGQCNSEISKIEEEERKEKESSSNSTNNKNNK